VFGEDEVDNVVGILDRIRTRAIAAVEAA